MAHPLLGGTCIFHLVNPPAIEEFAVNDLSANMEARRQQFGGSFGTVTLGNLFIESRIRHQKLSGELIALNLDALLLARQSWNVAVVERVPLV